MTADDKLEDSGSSIFKFGKLREMSKLNFWRRQLCCHLLCVKMNSEKYVRQRVVLAVSHVLKIYLQAEAEMDDLTLMQQQQQEVERKKLVSAMAAGTVCVKVRCGLLCVRTAMEHTINWRLGSHQSEDLHCS